MRKIFLGALGIAATTMPARAQNAGSSLLVEKLGGRIALALASSRPFAERSERAA